MSEPWICTCGLEMEYDEVQGCWFCPTCMALSEDSGDYVPPHERDDYFWEDLDEDEENRIVALEEGLEAHE